MGLFAVALVVLLIVAVAVVLFPLLLLTAALFFLFLFFFLFFFLFLFFLRSRSGRWRLVSQCMRRAYRNRWWGRRRRCRCRRRNRNRSWRGRSWRGRSWRDRSGRGRSGRGRSGRSGLLVDARLGGASASLCGSLCPRCTIDLTSGIGKDGFVLVPGAGCLGRSCQTGFEIGRDDQDNQEHEADGPPDQREARCPTPLQYVRQLPHGIILQAGV
jgi:hypothetical protein